MKTNIKQIIDASLEGYEGQKVQIIIKNGNEYFEGDDGLRNKVLEIFKTQKKIGSKIYVKDNQNNDFEIDIINIIETKDECVYEMDLKKAVKDQIYKSKRHMKNKFRREVYNTNKMYKDIKYIGITQAQQAHAHDKEVDEYVKLRDFLKLNPQQFSKKKLYVKTLGGEIIELRHKNLFSQYKDEISDFEKKTYIQREDNKMLQITYNLDEKILDYDQTKVGLIDRKNARFFAKEIYNKKGIFTDKELIQFLKQQDVYVKIKNILAAQNKLVWSEIKVEDMDIRTLEKEFEKTYKNKRERVKNIQTKYLSKRDKKRKGRRSQKKFIKEGLKEYEN